MPFLFPGFLKKAVTFSYDDGARQDIRLAECFRRHCLKATFNLNSGYLGATGLLLHEGFELCFDRIRPDEVKDLYRGFEVASHSVTHPDLRGTEDRRIQEEVAADVKALERLSGQSITGFAYPGGLYDDKLIERLAGLGIHYARTIESTGGFSFPDQLLAWHPSCHDADDRALGLVQRLIGEETEECRLLFIWGHSFELDKNDFDRWGHLERLCTLLGGRNDIWYATNGEICRYLKAAQAVKRDSAGRLLNPSVMPVYWKEGEERMVLPGKKSGC